MPALRSRTEHWLDSLRKVHERGGGIDISIDRGRPLTQESADRDQGGSTDVVWRVRILSISATSLLVEPPAAFGSTIPLQTGVKLVGAMTVGQNRWMFHTRTLGYAAANHGCAERPLLLSIPEGVERCTRRSFFRISTTDLRLPSVQCWPLLDPTSVPAAEAASEAQARDIAAGHAAPLTSTDPDSVLLPEVGPMFRASLLNISGGGLGLVLPQAETGPLGSRPFVWMRLDLRPDIVAPLAVTARVAHTHVDSGQNLYAGMAFDFTHNPSHRPFVVEMLTGYLNTLQRQQKLNEQMAA